MNSNLIWVDFIEIIPIILCGCVLPIMIVWMVIRKKMNESKDRTQIVMAALEKHPDMDVEELMKKISPKKKSLKEKLLAKLLWGSAASIVGIGLVIFGFFLKKQEIHMFEDVQNSVCFGVILLGIGIAFLINYFVGRRMLAKEIEAERNHPTTQE